MTLCLTEVNMNLDLLSWVKMLPSLIFMCLHVYIKLLEKNTPIDPGKFPVGNCQVNLAYYKNFGVMPIYHTKELTSILGFM